MSKKYVIPFTQAGFKKFKQEYDELVQKRPEYVQELATARDMGDRSENAAYKSARRRLSTTDSRLRHLKKILEHVKVVESRQTEYVEIGSQVTVNNGTKEFTYYIVGEYEADPMNGFLSFRTPVGQALLRKRVGDTVSVNLPAGVVNYTVMKIE